MTYRERVRRARRYQVLRFLADAEGYTASSMIIRSMLIGTEAAVPTTHEEMTDELNWLREHGLVRIAGDGDFLVAIATRRGVMIGRGEDRHDGIDRPLPGH